MMNAFKGEGIVLIGGKDRMVKFGTNATALFCQMHQIGLGRFGEMFTPENITPAVYRDLIYCALVSGARKSGETVDFDPETVGDWIDEMSEEGLMKIFEVFFASTPKNEDSGKKPMR
jgi:hypothetical protein